MRNIVLQCIPSEHQNYPDKCDNNVMLQVALSYYGDQPDGLYLQSLTSGGTYGDPMASVGYIPQPVSSIF